MKGERARSGIKAARKRVPTATLHPPRSGGAHEISGRVTPHSRRPFTRLTSYPCETRDHCGLRPGCFYFTVKVKLLVRPSP